MRTAIISDIHGNIDALNAVADDIKKQNCDSIVCLGDIVGYGYAPCECIDKVLGLHCTSIVTGNHDAAVVRKLGLDWFNEVSKAGVLRDIEKIDKDRKRILNNLSLQIESDERKIGKRKVVFTHGDLDGGYEFPYVDHWAEGSAAIRRMKQREIDILFVGHTHRATIFHLAPPSPEFKKYGPQIAEYDVMKHITYRIDGTTPVVANVGSVGYPRQQPFSVYAIYDDASSTIEWRRLPFDFNGYCLNLSNAGIPIPSWMYKWVEEGLCPMYWLGKRSRISYGIE